MDELNNQNQDQVSVNPENQSVETVETTEQKITEQPLKETFVEPEVDYSVYQCDQLIDMMKELLQVEDVSQIKNRMLALKNTFIEKNKAEESAAYEKFLNEGGDKDNYQPAENTLNEEFKKLSAEYSNRRKKHKEDEEKQKLHNLEEKKKLLEEFKKLIDTEDTLKKIYDDFNALQERWKTIGEVPRSENNNLWQNYHFYLDQFNNKVKMTKELKDLDMKRNLEQKIELCEKAEELIMEESVNKAFKQMQDYRNSWREIGPVPSDKSDEIWKRFCTAVDKINERRREHYDQMIKDQEQNLLAKTALCEQAEGFLNQLPTTMAAWNEQTEKITELQKVWRTIGPVPREMNDEIWNRFRTATTKFFETKKECSEQVRSQQSENYNRKVELCVKAEGIAQRTDWKQATEELLKLQEEWKTIGSVSKKLSEKVWIRFRAACDDFFNKKSEYYTSMKKSEGENLVKKQELIEKVKSFQLTGDKKNDLDTLKGFQRQWVEIGFVPNDKKEQLQHDFSEAINAHFNQMQVSAREAQEEIYRERIKTVAGDSKIVNEERRDLQDKIQKLKNDVNLWENNLGFFANSKQADLLKTEFEKKIQSTKQQIALLEAKLKIVSELKNNK